MTWLQENWIIAVVGLVVAVVLLWWLFGRKRPDEAAPGCLRQFIHHTFYGIGSCDSVGNFVKMRLLFQNVGNIECYSICHFTIVHFGA